MAACGSAGAQPQAPTEGQRTVFLFCPEQTPPYLVAGAPRSGCRVLVAGTDYAEGRVLIGVKAGTADAGLQRALDAYRATVVESDPGGGSLTLAVPAGTVPDAVVGLASYPFITFALPDLLQHPHQSVT